MRTGPILLLATLLVGCAETVVLPVEGTLSHQETVKRVRILLKDLVIVAGGASFFVAPSEKRETEHRTLFSYQHLTPQAPPALYTPAVSYDWTVIEIDTSNRRQLTLSVKTYRRGSFFDERQREV